MESAKKWTACTKNPGHFNFIPYPEFLLEHLPTGLQTQQMLNCVRKFADRTVMLRVGYTSTDRPEGYPFYDQRGLHRAHTGTGWISSQKTPALNDQFWAAPMSCKNETIRAQRGHVTCLCPNIATQNNEDALSRRICYEIHVITACHVVYDQEEARRTQVDIFYDEKGSKRKRIIWGFDVVEKDNENDTCTLRCLTHDCSLFQQLTRLIVCPGLPRCDCRFQDRVSKRRSACLIVSHPHGRPKHVPVGEMTSFLSPKFKDMIKYTAETCPGSSGALILRLADFVCPRRLSKPRPAIHRMAVGGLGQASLIVDNF